MLLNLKRCFFIIRICIKYKLYLLLPKSWLKTLICLVSGESFRKKLNEHQANDKILAENARKAMEQLGPIFIKFGQMLSTRHDLLSIALTTELAMLQDNVPGFDPNIAKQLIEKELKKPLDTCFAQFDDTPLASASVAQIHTAKLASSALSSGAIENMPTEVVVKVIRPDILPVIQQDLALLKKIARLVNTLVPESRRFYLPTLVEDYEAILLDELDLTLEAANAQTFADNFKGSDLLYVPKIYWPFVTSNIMVSERIYGVPVNDLDALQKAGVSMELLAERGAEIFFTQVFRDNFFHADMHPGNIFVDISRPELPRYIALDCAIAGRLSKMDLWLLGKQLLALMDQDYEALAKLMVHAGWVPKDTRIHAFANALSRVCRPVFSKPLSEIEFGQLLVNLFATARKFNLQSLPQLMLLEKTLLHVEGLGRQLYPDLDIWKIGRPLLESWLRSQYSPEKVFAEFENKLPLWLTYLPQLPKLITESIEGKVFNHSITTELKPSQTGNCNRNILAVTSLGFAAISAYDPQLGFLGWDAPLISWLACGLGLYLLIREER